MPLMSIASTAIDQTAVEPDYVRKNILSYLPNDTLCYLASPSEDRVLARNQKSKWDKLHGWVAGKDVLGAQVSADSSVVRNCSADGVVSL